MSDPYLSLFTNIDLDCIKELKEVPINSKLIDEIKNINPDHFDRSIIGTHLLHVFKEMIEIDKLENTFFKNMTVFSWKICWSVCCCIHITLKDDQWATYIEKAKTIIQKYNWLIEQKDIELFENLLYSLRTISFEHNIKQLDDLSYQYFQAYEKNIPFYITSNYMSLIISLIAKWCYGCTKFGIHFYEKMYNKKIQDFSTSDKVNTIIIQQTYCKKIISNIMMIYPSMDRFMYEEYTQFEGSFLNIDNNDGDDNNNKIEGVEEIN